MCAQDVLEVIKAPKIIIQGGREVTINKPCVYLPPMLPTASSKICLVDSPPPGMINPGEGHIEADIQIRRMTKPDIVKDEKSRMRLIAISYS